MAALRSKAIGLALLSFTLTACGDSIGGESSVKIDKSAVEGPLAGSFYQARDWVSAWDEVAANDLQEALAGAPAHGLRTNMFLSSPVPDDATRRDLALTEAAVRCASALSSGYVDPKSLGNIYTIPGPSPTLPPAPIKRCRQAKSAPGSHRWLRKPTNIGRCPRPIFSFGSLRREPGPPRSRKAA